MYERFLISERERHLPVPDVLILSSRELSLEPASVPERPPSAPLSVSGPDSEGHGSGSHNEHNNLMDTDGPPQQPPQPRHPADWARIFAAECGHPYFLEEYHRNNPPVLIWDHGKLTKPAGYTFSDFIDLDNESARLLVLRLMSQRLPPEDCQWRPITTFFIDDGVKKIKIKERL